MFVRCLFCRNTRRVDGGERRGDLPQSINQKLANRNFFTLPLQQFKTTCFFFILPSGLYVYHLICTKSVQTTGLIVTTGYRIVFCNLIYLEYAINFVFSHYANVSARMNVYVRVWCECERDSVVCVFCRFDVRSVLACNPDVRYD